jgi:hypothetical protein
VIIAAAVEWTPLIELLAVIIAAFGGIIWAIWSVASGAKRCATAAGQKAERADAVVQGLHKEVKGSRADMIEGFKHVNDRLDKFLGGTR